MVRVHDLRANCKVWLYSAGDKGVFGDGKARLLEAIAQHGSLQGACAALGISYRKAWADLRKAEACLGVRLVERVRGGCGGGHMTLTTEAHAVMAAYRPFRDRVTVCLQEAFETLLATLRNKDAAAGPGASPLRRERPGVRRECLD